MDKIIWYLKQLLPLKYKSNYISNGISVNCNWIMWFGKCYKIKYNNLKYMELIKHKFKIGDNVEDLNTKSRGIVIDLDRIINEGGKECRCKVEWYDCSKSLIGNLKTGWICEGNLRFLRRYGKYEIWEMWKDYGRNWKMIFKARFPDAQIKRVYESDKERIIYYKKYAE